MSAHADWADAAEQASGGRDRRDCEPECRRCTACNFLQPIDDGMSSHVTDADCVCFLKWCLPQLGLHWEGFRRVRKQVCKRLQRRLSDLGLEDLSTYRSYLSQHGQEWAVLDSLCTITISRFYRDRVVFDALRAEILPALARKAAANDVAALRCWSAGCSSGEEPYTLQIIWTLCVQPAIAEAIRLQIIATDVDDTLLERARRGWYSRSSLRDLPAPLVEQAFDRSDELYCIRGAFRTGLQFLRQDIRAEVPAGPFDLVLCRNLALTYFENSVQRQVLERVLAQLLPGGYIIVGRNESLPASIADVRQHKGVPGIYEKVR